MRITEDAKKAEFTVPKERFINAKDEIAHLTHDMHSLIVALWDGLKLPHVGRDPYLEFINKFLQPDPRERISVDEALEELKRQFPETFNSRE